MSRDQTQLSNIRQTPAFAMRSAELRVLHEQLDLGTVCAVSGGQGQTDLVSAYANQHAAAYPAGRWAISAAGHRELLPLLAELAFVPQFGYTPTEVERSDPCRLGRGVVAELQRRAEAGHGPALLVLEDVSDPELLGAAQLATLDPAASWLRLLATTRLDQVEVADPHLLPGFTALEPAAQTAVHFAALLPLDRVPWPWVRDLTQARHPELTDWDALAGQLQKLRLLTTTCQPEFGRSQWLLAAQVSGDELAGELVRHIVRRAEACSVGPHQPDAWELDALLAALPHLLDRHPERTLAFAALSLDGTVFAFRTPTHARALLAAAQRSLSRLAAADPDSPERQHDLSVAWEKLGVLAVAVGDLAEARQAHEAARTIRHALTTAEPANPAWQRALAASLVKLGDLAAAQGDPSAAQRLFAESLASAQRLVDAAPQNADYQRDLAGAQEKLGDLALAQGKHPEAQKHFAAALALRQALATAEEGQRDLSVTLEKLGDLAIAQGNLAQARQHYNEALALRQQLLATDPDDAQWQGDLAVALEKLGKVALGQGNLDEAQRLFAESIFQRLTADAGNADWQRDLSASLEKLGDLAVRQGDLPVARRLYVESFTLRQRLAAADPGNADWLRELSLALEKLGDVALAQHNLPEAERHFAGTLALRQRLVAADPADAEWQGDLAVALEKLGDVGVAAGNLPEAQRLFAEAIFQRLAADSGSKGWQRDLSVSLEKLGDLALAQNNPREAQRLFAECLALRQRLAAADPGNADWQRDLWVAHGRVAQALEQQGNATAADHWRQARDILAGLVQAGCHVTPQDRAALEQMRARVFGS